MDLPRPKQVNSTPSLALTGEGVAVLAEDFRPDTWCAGLVCLIGTVAIGPCYALIAER